MNESIPELQEEFAEIIPTVQEGTIIAGVQSINGKAGDLDLKTINNTDLLTAGNLNLATSDQLSDLETIVEGKQDQLSDAQLAAVNSGIDSTKVAQITTNKNNITTINGKIPAQATSTNKLADKNFVNSSIATNTANYISNNGQPFTSVAQLEAYTGTVTNNDYAFVTGTDSAGNTYYDRYKATVVGSTVTWAKEYRLNNSSFTSDQWTAINSGATTGLIEQITTNQNDIATLQTDKQDKLIAGTNIQIASDGKTISATDTKYTAGTGLTLTGTQFSVTEPVPAGFFTDTASTQEGEGTQFTLNNTTDAPIDGVELKGDTTQTTYSGKNLVLIEDGTISNNGVEYVKSGGVVSLTGAATANSSPTLASTFFNAKANTTYTLSANNPVANSGVRLRLRTSSGTISSFQLTTAYASVQWAPTEDIGVKPEIYLPNGTSIGTTPFVVKPMLEVGSQPTAFEPYVGGIPSPNPDYPQDIQVVTGSQTVTVTGKNLVDRTTATENKILVWTTGADSNSTGSLVTDYIHATAGDKLWLNYYAAVFFYDSAKTLIGHFGGSEQIITTAGGGYYLDFTVPSGYNIAFIRLVFRASEHNNPADMTVKDIMANKGTALQAFSRYAQSYTIDLGSTELAKIGNYRDYIWKDGADWKVHKATGKVTFDGTSEGTWSMFSNGNACYLNYPNLPQETDPSSSVTAMIVTDYYKGVLCSSINTNTPTEDYGIAYYGSSSTRSRFVLRNKDCADADALKTWLANHNTIVYHLLATPTDTVITDAALIAQLEALAGSTAYAPQTNYATAGTGTNLPVILTVEVFKNNYAGLLARLEKAGA